MLIKQLSVFIENRAGRMEQVTKTLKDNGINITSMSLADTSEYGMLRLIVSDPVAGKKALKEAGFSAMLTDVIGVKIPRSVGTLSELLCALEGVNIEYMYLLSTNMNAAIILKISDNQEAIKLLNDHGYELISEQEAYTIND